MRLFGIVLTSLASGLAELTFLQLSTTYPVALTGSSLGYFASGGGTAGISGATLWWEVRRLGVKKGIVISGLLVLITPLTYFFLLPPPSAFHSRIDSDTSTPTANAMGVPIDQDQGTILTVQAPDKLKTSLSVADKWRLTRPLLFRFMLPLFCVYTIEYTINQGIAPTLLYPVPDPARHWILHQIITDVRDYYPLWQLVYQTCVFLSRSSLALGLPALPLHLLGIPAIIQAFIFVTLAVESAIGIFPENPGITIFLIISLIAIEGCCGGLTYVNVFYRVGQESHAEEADDESEVERKKQERAFKIGATLVGDSLGIVLASLLAMPTEIGLCDAQVARGKVLCRTL